MIFILVILITLFMVYVLRETAKLIKNSLWTFHYRSWMFSLIPLGWFLLWRFWGQWPYILISTAVFALHFLLDSLDPGPSVWWFDEDKV